MKKSTFKLCETVKYVKFLFFHVASSSIEATDVQFQRREVDFWISTLEICEFKNFWLLYRKKRWKIALKNEPKTKPTSDCLNSKTSNRRFWLSDNHVKLIFSPQNRHLRFRFSFNIHRTDNISINVTNTDSFNKALMLQFMQNLWKNIQKYWLVKIANS